GPGHEALGRQGRSQGHPADPGGEAQVETLRTVDSIRADFPVFAAPGVDEVLRFDGPGGTQVPRAVIAAVTDYLINTNGNTHWNFPASRATDALLLDARDAFAE